MLADDEVMRGGVILKFDDKKVKRTEMPSTVTEETEYYFGKILVHKSVRVFLKPITIGARGIRYG